ncbi:MAG: AAA family ATPase [Spirochaetes bacterium GWD1_61_31]|nr:MAG: AAA family ATPase [Spirochaetes bacterium GWB1_60_80]OHD35222.1 MAG: AAA family ATPase [Spirochaetes bacterium GWC1_61_12]OHD41782.1 MAG: AAA family ATPase [Spirochaetes bacterium GWD1_61_31]OHD42588.1 MAG: AAA family ATPase [Spirochaetes bacterium GWE1_60_18]OHD59817.1 MAG: AAA family ATPase [Spirochaetes bacterium GWF1_60_12]HAP44168.1 AAA family ATPase [Spirochaetaceae bacterium]
MINRAAEATLQRLRKGFPVLCITGPRQSGKTTLARAAFPEKSYVSLEDPDMARLAREDPRGLLDSYKDGLILDEAQYVPELFAYLKTAVDLNPAPGRFVVTGSQQFSMLAGVTESLAGRAAFLSLLPFTISELQAAGRLKSDPFDMILNGFYPPLFDRQVSAYDWYTNYIASYIERDVRSVLNVKDLGVFQTFVKMCASRIGQLLNLSALALDCGLSHNTAKAWLSVLEASGIIYLLQPFHRNFGKRLVKSPKLYFTDTGLASRLLGMQSAEQLFLHPLRGHIFESFVVSEILKSRLNKGQDPDIYFWRDNVGAEVDVVFEDGLKLCALEIKSGKSFAPEHAAGLETWMKYAGTTPDDCSLVYAGDRSLSWKGLAIHSWSAVTEF